MRSRIGVALAVLASVVALIGKTAAQGPSGPTCEAVTKDPAKYAEEQVSFFGIISGAFKMTQIEGKNVLLTAVNCKTQDGQWIDGKFAYDGASEAAVEIAKKVDTSKVVLRYTGMVKGTVSIGIGPPSFKEEVFPFLKNVKIELSDDIK